jgi:nucleotide-binding universal stress UspA family protein
MLKHILVPLDGSELAEAAIPYAREIVAPDGKITLLSIMDVPDMQVYTLYEVPMVVQEGNYNRFVESLESSGRDYLERMVQRTSRGTYSVVGDFQAGDPASAIVTRAQELKVDAIVMSTHGRTGISRWLFGSVTQKVLSAMPCPVFVVRGEVREKSGETQETEAAGNQNLNPSPA